MVEDPTPSTYVEVVKLLLGGDALSVALRILLVLAVTGLVVAAAQYRRRNGNGSQTRPLKSIGIVQDEPWRKQLNKATTDVATLSGEVRQGGRRISELSLKLDGAIVTQSEFRGEVNTKLDQHGEQLTKLHTSNTDQYKILEEIRNRLNEKKA